MVAVHGWARISGVVYDSVLLPPRDQLCSVGDTRLPLPPCAGASCTQVASFGASGYIRLMTTVPSAQDAAASEELEVLTPDEMAELTEAEPEAEPVSYSGTDFDVEGLVRRLNRGDIVIPSFGHGDPTLEVAGFQRGFVWRKPQMDRFIESLLLGYPIPGIMLVQQVDKRYLVLDGQQRLRTLSAFYGGIHQGREFALDNVADEFEGLTYRSLSPEQKRQIDNTFIQATIVKTDGTPQSLESVYQVFERLNAGEPSLLPTKSESHCILDRSLTYWMNSITCLNGGLSTARSLLDCETKKLSYELSHSTSTPIIISDLSKSF